jgi:NADH-quinone oxidoreductase subunit I
MRLGDTDKDYYIGALTNPGTSAGAERAPWSETGTQDASTAVDPDARPETAGTARRTDAKAEAVSSGLAKEKGGVR